MVKINIKNNLGATTHSGTFVTQDDANQWISLNTDSGAWGKPERSLYVEAGKTLADFGEVESDVLSFTEIEYLGQVSKTYILKQTFSIESEDVTEEINKFYDAKKDVLADKIGKDIVNRIRQINRSKIISGSWDTEKVRSLKNNAEMKEIKESIKDGFFGLAFIDLKALDVTGFYSNEEKDEILSLIKDANSKTL